MHVSCPKCNSDKLVPDQADKDLLVCLQCYEVLPRESEINPDSIDTELMTTPPKGTWFSEDKGRMEFGTKVRYWASLGILLLASGFLSIGLLLVGGPLLEGRVEIFLLLLGLVFLFGGSVALYFGLFFLFGENRIIIENGELNYFVGVFGLGSKNLRKLKEITHVYMDFTYAGSGRNHGRKYFIVLKGVHESNLSVGHGLTREKREFLLNAFKYAVYTSQTSASTNG